jgi:vancomycin resistance protein YoaR
LVTENGVIIQPGEEFSFNQYLGPVRADTGFVPELVIKRSGTKPEFGGGVCQVSSTVFSTAVRAGLPITERRNHSYAVSYYEPGTDATIYTGSVDLKFVNDTPGAILLWSTVQPGGILALDFYGTNDGREILVEEPVQFDRKPNGSLKALWKRTVIKQGLATEDSFLSIYLSPALFQKQEQFVGIPASPSIPAETLPGQSL